MIIKIFLLFSYDVPKKKMFGCVTLFNSKIFSSTELIKPVQGTNYVKIMNSNSFVSAKGSERRWKKKWALTMEWYVFYDLDFSFPRWIRSSSTWYFPTTVTYTKHNTKRPDLILICEFLLLSLTRSYILKSKRK